MTSFEDALSELKVIIEKLESGNLSLEESLGIFQRGVELISICNTKLDEVQKKIEVLVENTDGGVVSKEFEFDE